MIVGIVVPWYFFSGFIAQHGLALDGFLAALYANDAAGGFSSDIFISATVFWVWSYCDGQKLKVQHWWLVLPATLFVGLSMALPLYLLMRHTKAELEH